MLADVFVLPVVTQYLIYAPRHHLAALVDRVAIRSLAHDLLDRDTRRTGSWGELLDVLRSPGRAAPLPRHGPLEPAFLGLLPTRACNLACAYCGFQTVGADCQSMDLELARSALDWYLELVTHSGRGLAEVHFFGGEPFCAPEVIDFAVHHARLKAARLGCQVRFEVATNGMYGEERCRWAADNLDSIVLSLDGPADVQDRQRPRRGGQGSFETVVRAARILSEGRAELALRACVTAETVDRLPAIAAWMCREFRPASVCFEAVQPTAGAEAAGVWPPDPWDFCRCFLEAAAVLESFGVEAVYTAADIDTLRASFCPVGRDAVIVSADGSLAACYLLPGEWASRGLDLSLGQVRDGQPVVDDGAVAAARDLNVWNKPFCQGCFCKWHCAGGCHVNHALPERAGDYDRLCIQTRAIALGNILKALGRGDCLASLLAGGPAGALARAVQQPSDLIADVAGGL